MKSKGKCDTKLNNIWAMLYITTKGRVREIKYADRPQHKHNELDYAKYWSSLHLICSSSSDVVR